MRRKLTHEEFIVRLNNIKPFIKCVDGERYSGSFNKLKFICSSGHIFSSSPSNILNDKYIGCKRCSAQKMSNEKMKDHSEFVRQVSLIHPNYEVVGEYRSCFSKVELLCDKGHKFSSRANDILYGTGCSICRTSGYKDNLPGTLYYLRVEDGGEIFYKIGITNLSVSKRFNMKDRAKITILMEEYYENGLLARIAERQVLDCFKEFIAKDVNILKKGNTELFIKDVLSLDDSVVRSHTSN